MARSRSSAARAPVEIAPRQLLERHAEERLALHVAVGIGVGHRGEQGQRSGRRRPRDCAICAARTRASSASRCAGKLFSTRAEALERLGVTVGRAAGLRAPKYSAVTCASSPSQRSMATPHASAGAAALPCGMAWARTIAALHTAPRRSATFASTFGSGLSSSSATSVARLGWVASSHACAWRARSVGRERGRARPARQLRGAIAQGERRPTSRSIAGRLDHDPRREVQRLARVRRRTVDSIEERARELQRDVGPAYAVRGRGEARAPEGERPLAIALRDAASAIVSRASSRAATVVARAPAARGQARAARPPQAPRPASRARVGRERARRSGARRPAED